MPIQMVVPLDGFDLAFGGLPLPSTLSGFWRLVCLLRVGLSVNEDFPGSGVEPESSSPEEMFFPKFHG